MPEVQAHLADGTILSFPEGTADSVVQSTVKRHLGASPDPLNRGIPDKPPGGSVSSGAGTPQPDTATRIGDFVDAARPFSIPAALSTGLKVPGPLPVKVAAGAATYLGADTALQKIRNMLQGSDEAPDLADSAKNLAINELGGRALGVVARGANAGLGKVSKFVSNLFPGISASLTPAQEELSKLSPTFSQYFGNKPIPKTLEDLFASGTKANAIKNSGRLADSAITQEASAVSGRAPSVVNNPEDLAGRIQVNNLENSYNSTFREADKQAQNAKLIAQGNISSFINTSTGEVTPIAGPIHLDDTLTKANKIFSNYQNLVLDVPEDQKAALNKAYQLIKRTDSQFDQSGQLIKRNPVPFEEAWELKKEFDDLSGWGKPRGQLTSSERSFRDMASSINDDIDASIPKWKNGGKQASQAWQNSKSAAAQRNVLFSAEGSGNKLSDIIRDVDSPVPAIDSILNDPKQLQRALNTGSIKFRSGAVSSSNMRGDLQAYNLVKLRDASKAVDPAGGGVTINGQQLYNNWIDPRSPRNNSTLYSASQKSDYDQLFKNIAATQTKQSAFGSALSKLYLVKGGLAVAPVLLGLSTGGIGTAGEVAAVELGAMGLARLMAKPETARILVAAAGGQPLTMSEQMASRRLTAGLQGVTIALTHKDGTKSEGSFDKEGNFKDLEH